MAGATAARRSRTRPAHRSPTASCSRRSKTLRIHRRLLPHQARERSGIPGQRHDSARGGGLPSRPDERRSAGRHQFGALPADAQPGGAQSATDLSNPTASLRCWCCPSTRPSTVPRASTSTAIIGGKPAARQLSTSTRLHGRHTHNIQLAADDPVDNELTDLYYYVIPRNKANYSVAWTHRQIHDHGAWLAHRRTAELRRHQAARTHVGLQRVDQLPLHAATDGEPYRRQPHGYEARPRYHVDDLPLLRQRWFSPIGRAYFVEVSYRFGGKPVSRNPAQPCAGF